MIVAVHQPNFFPWLGYFAKIARSDAFVFLDEVQFPRTGKGNWVNRVKWMSGGAAKWWTCPVARTQSAPRIMDVGMAEPQWRDKALRTLTANYAKAPHFKAVFPLVTDLVQLSEDRLALFNMNAIRTLSDELGLTTAFVRQSEMADDAVREHAGSARLAAICAELGADTYLAGDGADGYEDASAYADRGIALTNNRFACAPYPQAHGGDFIPGLTILDALFNLGPRETARLIA